MGRGTCVPLGYRFKHFERANAFALRGTRFHGFLPRVLALAWPNGVADANAEDDIVAAAIQNGQELTFNEKSNIRAGKLMKYMAEDPDGHRYERAAAMTRPTQKYMNAVFKADSIACEFADACTRGARSSAQDETNATPKDPANFNWSF